MKTRRTLHALGALLVVYLAVPVVAFAERLATSSQRGFTEPGLWPALGVSLEASTISLVFMTLFGVPLAYALARSRSRWSNVVGVVVQLPLAIPPIMSGVLLVYVIGPYSWLGVHVDRNLTQSLTGIIIAQTFVSTPFLVVAARTGFEAVDPALEDVAASCGHRPLSRFWQIDLRGAASGIQAGMVLAWLRAFGEYGAVVIIAFHPFSLPVYTEQLFSGTGLPATQAPTFLALAIAAVAIYLGRVRWRARRTPPVGLPAAAEPPVSKPVRVSFDLDTTVGGFHLRFAYQARSHRLAIVGPSGSGKSITLRALAGLRPGAGTVCYGAEDVSHLPAEERRIGYVPQGAALLPERRVWQQVNFAVDANPARAAWWLARLRIAELAERLPAEVSGGQAQRVSLARALSRDPRLVLLDEPLSALDTAVRHELREELHRLQDEAGLSTVLVTHDPEEAAMLADEILVIDNGQLLQAGPCTDVFRHPASPEIARLLRIDNVRPGIAAGGGVIEVSVADGQPGIRLDTSTDTPSGTPVLWSVHPNAVIVDPAGPYRATVADVTNLGSLRVLTLEFDGGLELRAWSLLAGRPQRDEPCRVSIEPDRVSVWNQDPRGLDRSQSGPAVGQR
ncbi:MAG: ATP-binding cassette domain-containing protein [Acidimicrobiaceae bacterium]|nr:ATP-binding cassette domain-containing protein [Acidimicrobiaceae bacterium]